MDWSGWVGRMFAGVAVNLVIGSVINYAIVFNVADTVISNAVAGLQTNSETLNKRLDDVISTMNKLDDRLFIVSNDLNKGFKDTRTEIQKKAELNSSDDRRLAMASLRSILEGAVIRSAEKSPTPTTIFLPNAAAWAQAAAEGKIVDVDTNSEQAVDGLLSSFKIDQYTTYLQLADEAKRNAAGVSFTTAKGENLKAVLSNGSIVLTDKNGNEANIVDSQTIGDKMQVYTIDNILNVN